MKISLFNLTMTTVMATLAVADPQPPVGSLIAKEKIVISGKSPTLEWNVRHPSKNVDDLVRIDKNHNVQTKKKLRVDVYMLGTGITSDYGRTQHETQAAINLGNGYRTFFSGKGRDVTPSNILISNVIPAGTKISFKAFFEDWRDNTSPHVIILKDDDPLPTGLGRNNSVHYQNYLSMLIKNGKLDMGPSDIVYCAELTDTDTGSRGYDLQDSIVLLRFTEID